MRRIELTEIHDHPRFPSGLRNLVTDALQALWEFGNSYKPILGILSQGLSACAGSPASVTDLCSGGGGPWMALIRQLKEKYRLQVRVRLTDKYPNTEAFERIAERSLAAGVEVGFATESVDAINVPEREDGFRTIFSAFHHFGPTDARELLRNAALSGRGIGVFEVARRGLKTFVVLCFTPILLLWLTPGIRPFRWSRIFWTYILPVVPFVIGYDGWVSCFGTYSQAELRELVRGIEGYKWHIGEARSGFLPVTYIVGYPSETQSQPEA